MQGTLHGSCHCGAVRFEADIDIAPKPAAPWRESTRYAWCGVTPFASGELEQMGGRFYALNIGSLDDAAPADLAALPIRYEDGRHDAWDQEPVERQHL